MIMIYLLIFAKNKTEEYFTTKSKTFLEELNQFIIMKVMLFLFIQSKIIFYYNNDTKFSLLFSERCFL